MKTEFSVWRMEWRPPVLFKDIRKIKSRATRWQRILLKFKRTQYSFDGKHTIPYKDMGKRRYVLVKKVKPAPNHPITK